MTCLSSGTMTSFCGHGNILFQKEECFDQKIYLGVTVSWYVSIFHSFSLKVFEKEDSNSNREEKIYKSTLGA